jgi:phosphoenolpyruvate synthase/pyruvate phosphate dikinase
VELGPGHPVPAPGADPADLGTAVNVVAMVFGNLGSDSGTGVAFTRDPASGAQGVYGDYLANAQGEDVVAGIRNTVPLQELEQLDKTSFDELMRIMSTGGSLQRPVRHRVHHRARQALDAADPGRQAHRRGRVRHRGQLVDEG